MGHVRRVLFASPDYLARRGNPRILVALKKHDIVFYSDRPTPTSWRFRTAGRDRIVRVTPILMVTDAEALIFAARSGRGIGRALSYQVAEEFSSGALVRLLPEFEPAARPVHLVVPTKRHMLPSVRAFLDCLALGLDTLPAIHGIAGL